MPRITTLAVRYVFKPHIGRSRTFSLPMVAIDPIALVLAGVGPAGRNQFSITFANAGAGRRSPRTGPATAASSLTTR